MSDQQPFTAATATDLKYATVDGSLVTAFGHLRIAHPQSIFDSKQLYDNQPLFWDDQETSGAGTSSSHSTNTVMTTISVSAATAGTRVRQTYQCFNYQPGKSQVAVLTGILGSGGPGITSRIGLFSNNNGVFFEVVDGVLGVVIRSNTSGSPVDTRIAQADWNVDPLNGEGSSRINLDLDKTQIFWIDFQWLAVGRVRFGFSVDGALQYCHEASHANVISVPYMSNPNLPLRYEISNDGTGAAASVNQICSAVYSEGGTQEFGVVLYESTTSNRLATTAHIDANAANAVYAVLGIRLKASQIAMTVHIISASLLALTNDNFEWLMLYNPTVAGTFTFGDKADSALQTAIGDGAGNPSTNTVSDLGTVIAGGYANSSNTGGDIAMTLDTTLHLGAAIDGTPSEIVLAVRPLTSNLDIHGGLDWREMA